ncbi:MAG: PDZ domain-containing protein [Chloroflexi bacterium]|nr:PDZ domain-containing protein [Chloroflexota bacterium]
MAMSSVPAQSDNSGFQDDYPGRKGLGSVIVLSIMVALVAGIVAGSLTAWLILRQAQTEPVVAAQTPQITYVQEAEASAAAVYQAVSPSVVTIWTLDEDRPRGIGSGTGIIVDGQGHIVTNNHVVSQADRVRVQLFDGSTLFAEIVGRDPATDLAVIRANLPQDAFQVARFGDSTAVKPGDPVFAIGAPYGFSHSITAGIVSAVGRTYPERGRLIAGLIQSDTEINPGNSGGPLLNANGEVIGITTAIQTSNQRFQGVGLSIPSNLVQRLLPQLIEGEDIRRTFLGVQMDTITPQEARERELDVDQGIWVTRVAPGSPAQKAGIRGSSRSPRFADIITAIDGLELKTADDLIAYIQSKNVGDTISITVHRNGEAVKLDATLGAWPNN